MPALLPILALVLVLAAPAPAAEDPHAHAAKAQKTVTLDNDRIAPEDLRMAAGDALAFQNFSVHTMQVTFVEPKDAATKIRCGLVGMPGDQRPAWAVFDVRDGALVGVVPPGRFGSLCALAPGHYAYVVKRVDAQAASGGQQGEKGDIHVQ